MQKIVSIHGFWMLLFVMGSMIGGCVGWTEKKNEKRNHSECTVLREKRAYLSEVINKELDRRLKTIKEISKDQVIIDCVREANRENATLHKKDIMKLDNEWCQSDTITELMKTLLTNDCSQSLVDFQDKHNEYSEIFITDCRGLNVCQTNRTSDYFQADEEWWNIAYNDGRGKSYYGMIEFDESIKTESIAVYAPVVDSETKKVIGIVKAVCSITSIKMDL